MSTKHEHIVQASICFLVSAVSLGGSGCGERSHNSCDNNTSRPVAWTEQADQTTPQNIFGDLAASANSQLTWDFTGTPRWSASVPVSGTGSISVGLAVNQDSAVYYDHSAYELGTSCNPFGNSLTIDAVVDVTALGAPLVAGSEVAIRTATDGTLPLTFRVSVGDPDVRSWLSQATDISYAPGPDEHLSLSLDVDMSRSGCVGSASMLSVDGTPDPNHISVGDISQVSLDDWTDATCQ